MSYAARDAALTAGWVLEHYLHSGNGVMQVTVCPKCVPWFGKLAIRRYCLKNNFRLGWPSRWLFQSYGACRKCGTSWACCRSHTTYYTDNRGCFAMCKPCWRESSIEQRLKYYQKLFDDWFVQGCGNRDSEDAIRAAVREGL